MVKERKGTGRVSRKDRKEMVKERKGTGRVSRKDRQ